MKKLVVVGKGTAGCQAIAHFVRWMPNCEFEWHYDPNIQPQSVGEGSVLSLPKNMFMNLGFSHQDLKKIDGTLKTGIYKKNWGKKGKEFFHDFPAPNVAYHFNAVKLQNYIYEVLKDRIKVVEHNTNIENIDADYIMDCSGKPKDLELFDIPKYIPVNSVHVIQCWWEYPRLDHTLTIARPYGWVFGIPLQNRCSIGYMYNNQINSIDEIKEDILNVINDYKLTPSDTTNSFTFGNYKRKVNFKGNIAFNGNSSFFLEPLEATSIDVMDNITRNAFDVWNGKISTETANSNYQKMLDQTEKIIMMHYFSGSVFKTKFWEFAKERGTRCMKEAQSDQSFKFWCDVANKYSNFNRVVEHSWSTDHYSVWWPGSFVQNVNGLGINKELSKILKI